MSFLDTVTTTITSFEPVKICHDSISYAVDEARLMFSDTAYENEYGQENSFY